MNATVLLRKLGAQAPSSVLLEDTPLILATINHIVTLPLDDTCEVCGVSLGISNDLALTHVGILADAMWRRGLIENPNIKEKVH